MLRAYQSPYSGWHCGPQCAQMPNLASRYHSGVWYCWSDSHVGPNLPLASIYMLRAYQSPYSGWHCGPQCAEMPNLASRYHSGVWYCWSDSHVGPNLPLAMGSTLSPSGERNCGAAIPRLTFAANQPADMALSA